MEADYARPAFNLNPPSHAQSIPIPFSNYGRRRHPFWPQKYCPSHEHDNTARWCSSDRLVSWNARLHSLADGRSLCFECTESAIISTGACQPLYHDIRAFFDEMNMRIDQQFPVFIVHRDALNDAIAGENIDFRHKGATRGLCLSEEQTVNCIMKRPRIGDKRLIGMRTNPQKLTRNCQVTAILVLCGLPRLLTGAMLAHELTRAYLRLKNFRNLSTEVEEGICHVVSKRWLVSEMTPSSLPKKAAKPDFEEKLGEFLVHQTSNDSFPGYGGGYATAEAAVNKYGLRRTLDHVRMTGDFPL